MAKSIKKPDLIDEILQLMNLSSMSEQEKTIWQVMLPSMKENEILQFKAVLEKEVKQMTNIYLGALQKKKA